MTFVALLCLTALVFMYLRLEKRAEAAEKRAKRAEANAALFEAELTELQIMRDFNRGFVREKAS